jgi:hypothetical protein
MLLLTARRSLAARVPSAVTAQRIHSRTVVHVRFLPVQLSSQTALNRWLSVSSSSAPQDDDESLRKAEKEKLTAALLRQQLLEDVQRAKELVSADVERAKDLALHQVVNVPNAITFARILATPYLGYLIYDGSYTTAVGGKATTWHCLFVESVPLTVFVNSYPFSTRCGWAFGLA